MMTNQRKTYRIDFERRPIQVMGILNVTPDSFSDGGHYLTEESITAHVREMIAAGADIIDIGGESTRPFSTPVSESEELDRVIPAIKAIRRHHDVPISIDTTKAEVARLALMAGADIVNDISALRFDENMAVVMRDFDVPVIIMHMQGTPKNMQTAPAYDNVISETIAFFKERISYLQEFGIAKERIIIDPGIGFGKTINHNLSIIRHLEEYKSLGCPVLVGHSRKSFIGTILENSSEDRDVPTAIISAILALRGASIIRVHNVSVNNTAIRLINAVMAAV